MANYETMRRRQVGYALEDYYLSCGVNPIPEVADYSSAKPAAGTALQPGEKVTLPAQGEAAPPAA